MLASENQNVDNFLSYDKELCSYMYCHWSFGLLEQRFPCILYFRFDFSLCVFYGIYIQELTNSMVQFGF